jgi:hypothetical protein
VRRASHFAARSGDYSDRMSGRASATGEARPRAVLAALSSATPRWRYHDLAHQGVRQGAVFAPHRIVHEPPRGIRDRCSPRRRAVWCQRRRRAASAGHFGGWVLAKQNEYPNRTNMMWQCGPRRHDLRRQGRCQRSCGLARLVVPLLGLSCRRRGSGSGKPVISTNLIDKAGTGRRGPHRLPAH